MSVTTTRKSLRLNVITADFCPLAGASWPYIVSFCHPAFTCGRWQLEMRKRRMMKREKSSSPVDEWPVR
ncbi:hypothetical protein TIFTF001_004462 [Ficus carica]|uniref:Uncharacterized protein n=1 Tax=Ficus carica TaxID=3494 RepID=A0AA87ZBS2_FICCA|nr:hypothetical protein TIFTF001_004462 [Ficus carica]